MKINHVVDRYTFTVFEAAKLTKITTAMSAIKPENMKKLQTLNE